MYGVSCCQLLSAIAKLTVRGQPGYNPSDVEVRSTNIERTLESARMVLTGLFGASGPTLALQLAPFV